MKLKIFVFVAAVFAVIGCHAQVPPTNRTVTLTWTAPTTCTTAAPCTFVISRATLAAGTTTCPTTLTTNYTPLNQSAPTSALEYVDPSAAGTLDCYIAQTLQAGGVSQPSNTAGPVSVPTNPVAPSLNNPPTVARATGNNNLLPDWTDRAVAELWTEQNEKAGYFPVAPLQLKIHSGI